MTDLYASLAAVTLPDSGKSSRPVHRADAWRLGTAIDQNGGPDARSSATFSNSRAMPLAEARAADASHSSLLRVSTTGGIAIAAFALLYFGGELLRAVLS